MSRIYFTALMFLAFESLPVMGLEYPYTYRSAHYLGRGDTGIADADYENAVFYNPAGLAQGQGLYKRLVLVSPTMDVSKSAAAVTKDLIAKADPIKVFKGQQGVPQHIGFSQFTGLILRRAALGVYARSSTYVLLAQDASAGASEGLEAYSVSDVGGTFSIAEGFFSNRFFMGTTVKYLKRAQIGAAVNVIEAQSLKGIEPNSLAMLGTGVGVDVGFMFRATQSRNKPSLGLTLQDVGDTKFTPDSPTEGLSSESPLRNIPQTLNLGLSVAPGTKISQLKLLLDVRDILGHTHNSWFKRIHTGMDLNVREVAGVTFGLNQGYPTVGVYFDIRVVRLDIGVYTEELDSDIGIRPDTRYFGRIMVGL